MTSYLIIVTYSKFISDNKFANLFDLIGFRLALLWLQVKDFRNALAVKDMVVSSDSQGKTERHQEVAKRLEREVMVGIPAQDLIEEFSMRGQLRLWMLSEFIADSFGNRKGDFIRSCFKLESFKVEVKQASLDGLGMTARPP